MIETSDLLLELETLPKGYISKKTIKGKTYYYLQYFQNGKIHSEYIKKENLKLIFDGLKRRKEIEELLKSNKPSHPISKRMKSLTGYLMMEDIQVAYFKNGILMEIDENKAPLYVLRTKNIEEYLKYRSIDLDRSNARLLLKYLGIQNKDIVLSLYSNGATISDNYWFKPSGSKLKFKDITFDNDLFSDLALKGKLPQLPSLGFSSPELTNIGSFEKSWKIVNNEWWLYKAGSEDNIFSELFCYYFALLLDIPTAIYEYDNGYIRSKNFADKYNFEPMYALIDDNEDYNDVFNCLIRYGEEIAKSYLKLIIFDLTIYNVDRHNHNYGLLRDKKTGEIISLAPNFDNNLALISYNKTLNQDVKKDPMIKLFINLISKNAKAKEIFNTINIPNISNEELNNIHKNIVIKRDPELINSFILVRLNFIKSLQS